MYDTPDKLTDEKLNARLAEIDASGWSDEEKERVRALAIRNHETWASVTSNGCYTPRGVTGGEQDDVSPSQPFDNDLNNRIAWQDAYDPS